MSDRVFEDSPAVRGNVPLIVGLMGPQGVGKTFSALEISTGIVSISGGEIFLVDTENRRGLHYADRFKFRHVPFDPPYGSLDYVAVINHCVSKGAGCIIIDSTSHEHEGVGGVLESHEAELDRMAGSDWKKREACQMIAWVKPKADHRKFRIAMSQAGCHIIFCFRCKDGSKPIRGKDGKITVEKMGFTPIAGDDLSFEMTVQMLLLPQANGLPTWRSDEIGEKLHMKLPVQFRGILDDGKPLSREHGRNLAEWARGAAPAPAPEEDLVPIGNLKAAQGLEVLRAWWESLPVSKAKKAAAVHMPDWKALAEQTDAASAPAVPPSEPEPSPEPPNGGIIHHPRNQPTMDDMREVMSETPIERPAPTAEPPAVVQQTMEERL